MWDTQRFTQTFYKGNVQSGQCGFEEFDMAVPQTDLIYPYWVSSNRKKLFYEKMFEALFGDSGHLLLIRTIVSVCV